MLTYLLNRNMHHRRTWKWELSSHPFHAQDTVTLDRLRVIWVPERGGGHQIELED